jgi:magnesium transporter
MARIEELHNALKNLLKEGDDVSLGRWLTDVEAADLAIMLSDCSEEETKRVFYALHKEESQHELIMFAEGELKNLLFSFLPQLKQVQFLEEVPPDEAVDMVETLEDDDVSSLLEKLDIETAEEIKGLRQYEEGTAGALMTPDFLQVRAHAKLQHVVKIIGSTEDLESIDQGFVLTDMGKILGMFKVSEILTQTGNPFVVQFIDENVVTVYDTDSDERAYQIMSRYGLDILPVVNHSGQMKGIITADDMLDVAKNISDQDFYQMVGTSGDPTGRSVWARAWHRIPWLVTTLVGGLVSGYILRTFHLELQAFAALVVFLPFVIAMAGNVGVQSATIIVRELVNQEQTQVVLRKDVFREMMTGLLNATIFGIGTAILLAVWVYFSGGESLVLGPAIGTALFSSMGFAALIGANIPILFSRLGIDPAISSGPIITMTMDVIGLTIYLSVATGIFHFHGLHSMPF